MLMSLDGKISTGDTDEMDFDKDLKRIVGVKEGLSQYYEREKWTDAFSLNTGRVMAKIGVNDRETEPVKIPALNFVIIDNQPHLTAKGVEYLSKWAGKLFLATTDPNHPAKNSRLDNVVVINYENEIDFADLFRKLKEDYGAERLTVQSGGTLNAYFIRQGLIDRLSIVVAPVIVGGAATATLIDGESLHHQSELEKIRPLKLTKCEVLKDSYLYLEYEVVRPTIIE